ncbi:MAG: hypothetical protein MZV63_29715 [Marinilabiliales bacterium]|nr:hypothetical protein [Marinilabiliales bacterium]
MTKAPPCLEASRVMPGLFATGNDLLKLVEMYRRGGEYGGVRVLSSDVLREYTRVQFPENENRRGLGFDKPLLGNDTIPPEEAYPCPISLTLKLRSLGLYRHIHLG